MRMLISAALAVVATAAAAQAPDAAVPALPPEAATALAGRTAGRPVDCVTLRDVRSTQIIDRTAIIYQMSSKRWLVNFPAGGCPALRKNLTIVTRTPSTRLCRGDIAAVVDPVVPMELGSCNLGSFVPYTK